MTAVLSEPKQRIEGWFEQHLAGWPQMAIAVAKMGPWDEMVGGLADGLVEADWWPDDLAALDDSVAADCAAVIDDALLGLVGMSTVDMPRPVEVLPQAGQENAAAAEKPESRDFARSDTEAADGETPPAEHDGVMSDGEHDAAVGESAAADGTAADVPPRASELSGVLSAAESDVTAKLLPVGVAEEREHLSRWADAMGLPVAAAERVGMRVADRSRPGEKPHRVVLLPLCDDAGSVAGWQWTAEWLTEVDKETGETKTWRRRSDGSGSRLFWGDSDPSARCVLIAEGFSDYPAACHAVAETGASISVLGAVGTGGVKKAARAASEAGCTVVIMADGDEKKEGRDAGAGDQAAVEAANEITTPRAVIRPPTKTDLRDALAVHGPQFVVDRVLAAANAAEDKRNNGYVVGSLITGDADAEQAVLDAAKARNDREAAAVARVKTAKAGMSDRFAKWEPSQSEAVAALQAIGCVPFKDNPPRGEFHMSCTACSSATDGSSDRLWVATDGKIRCRHSGDNDEAHKAQWSAAAKRAQGR